MIADNLYDKLNTLRGEYRHRMNDASEKALIAAQEDDMSQVSLYSTDAERAREAFTALNRAIAIIEAELSIAVAVR